MPDGRHAHEIKLGSNELHLVRSSPHDFALTITHATDNFNSTYQQYIPAETVWDAQNKAYEVLKQILKAEKDALIKSIKALDTAIAERDV